jgi:hypothetical protein
MDQAFSENNNFELLFLVLWIITLLRSALSDYYAAYSGNSLPAFQETYRFHSQESRNLQGAVLDFLTFDDRIFKLSRNVGKKLSPYAAQKPRSARTLPASCRSPKSRMWLYFWKLNIDVILYTKSDLYLFGFQLSVIHFSLYRTFFSALLISTFCLPSKHKPLCVGWWL